MGNNNTIRNVTLKECRPLGSGMEEALADIAQERTIPPAKFQDLRLNTRFIDHIWRNCCKAIVDVPCGGGKSTWAIAHMLDCIRRWQDPRCSHDSDPPAPNPIYLVVDTLTAGIERLNELVERMGVSDEYVGFYHSHWEEECKRLRGNDAKTFHQIVRDPRICMDCSTGHECFYRNRNTEIAKKIVILTHEGFIRLHERGRIPSDRDIIIDEEPSLYFTTMLSVRDLSRFAKRLHALDSNVSAIQKLRDLTDKLLELGSSPAKHRSTLRWDLGLTHDDRIAAIREFERLAAEQAENTGIGSWQDMAEAVIPESLTLVYRLGYAFVNGATTYVYCDEDRLSVCRDRVHFDISNRVILLNGSAQVARHLYPEGMNVWTCPEIKPHYPNVTLHCLCGLPTKKWFRQESNVHLLMSEATAKLKTDTPIFLAINHLRDGNKVGQSVIELAQSAFRRIRDEDIGQRGTIKGSNKWLGHQQGIIASSWFTDVPHYALCASIRHNRCYSADELFQENGQPKFKRGRKLALDDLNDEFLRQAADDIYQTVMRLACRHDAAKQVDVVLVVPNVELLACLGKLMPNIRICSDEFNLAFADVLLNTVAPLTNDEIYRKLKLGKSSGKNAARVRQIAAMFDWVKGKGNGKRGNHVMWRPRNGSGNAHEEGHLNAS